MGNPDGWAVEAEGRYPARVSSPLAAEVHAFRTGLVRAGYTARMGRDNAYVMACLSRWLEAEGLTPPELTAGQLERFAAARRAAGYRRWRTVRFLRLLLRHLRDKGLVPDERPPDASDPAGRILDAFGRYLRTERQLAERTVSMRVHLARPFLSRLTLQGAELGAAEEPRRRNSYLEENGRGRPRPDLPAARLRPHRAPGADLAARAPLDQLHRQGCTGPARDDGGADAAPPPVRQAPDLAAETIKHIDPGRFTLIRDNIKAVRAAAGCPIKIKAAR